MAIYVTASNITLSQHSQAAPLRTMHSPLACIATTSGITTQTRAKHAVYKVLLRKRKDPQAMPLWAAEETMLPYEAHYRGACQLYRVKQLFCPAKCQLHCHKKAIPALILRVSWVPWLIFRLITVASPQSMHLGSPRLQVNGQLCADHRRA
eukprot:1507940-Amphidinium_carterae.1